MKALNWIIAAFAIVATFITEQLGGWTQSMTTLCIFMAIDILTGLLVCTVFKKSAKTETGTLSSAVGIKGFIRKGIVIVIVFIARRMDLALGVDYIMLGAIYAYIVVEIVSIIENCGLMGVPIPAIITNAIDLLKKKGGNNENK